MANPFFNRGPIQDPRFFLERRDETREVARLLAGVQNCSIVGPVKSGKTSLLFHLTRQEVLREYDLDGREYGIVYLSLEGLADLQPEHFFHLMLRESARQTRGKIGIIWPQFERREAISFLELRQVVEQVGEGGEKLVICLDELEMAAENPAFDLNFFSALRAIASLPNVCFITASARPLHELKAAGRKVGSPFADLFSIVRLRPVAFDAVWESFCALALEAGVDIRPERDLVKDLGGGWLHHLQVAAYEVFERKSAAPKRGEKKSAPIARRLTKSEREFVSLRAYEQVEPALTIMWERLSREERKRALAALEGRSEGRGVDGLTITENGGARPLNALAKRFLEGRRHDQEEPLEAYFTTDIARPDRMRMYGMVRALMRAVEARDRYARGHADRVTRLAVAIAKEMGCPEEVVEAVKVAGRLHDIGRVSISDTILLKPGPLTPMETEIIRTHPLVGVQILDAVDFPWAVKPAVRYHHERLDGSGYPEGLIGDEIPFAARLLAVADTMAAMTADRPYRRALPAEEAIQHLVANAGTQYDSAVVEALQRVVARGIL